MMKAAVWKPLDVVVLGIDVGAQSGWGIWKPGTLLIGTIRDRVGAEAERIAVVESAIDEAQACDLNLVVVAEKWTAGGFGKDRRMSATTLMGLGGAWRDWQRVLKHFKVPQKRILRVNVRTWQGSLLSGLGARHSAALKSAAQAVVCSRFPSIATVPHEPDAYDAGCICLWGSQSGEVATAVANSRRWPGRQK
jgi:hypothetical protein